ncbi:hypothetical protein OSB04_un000539 [Centaurea solstitialis]|uniref:Reverse transcriptase domain-containing protein n=1 Tax=Centaurea solstitialis TaxID=347529 RepID=A0AA38S5R3_9ASTR|nr:hypothetical protein OSB04_un000539 [Centaurea solstitialis]
MRVNAQQVTFNLFNSLKCHGDVDDCSTISINFTFEQLDFKDKPNQLPSIVQQPELELKPLPSHLKYAYLLEGEKLPVIISSKLDLEQEKKLLRLLGEHKKSDS